MPFFLLFLSLTSFASLEGLLKESLSVDGGQCAFFEEDTITYFETDAEKEGFKKVKCPDPWVDRTFYMYVHHGYCKNRFGDSAFTCVESNPAKIKQRIDNATLFSKISSYAEKKFESYRKELATECCGTKAKCLKRFGAIELKLDPSAEADAAYESDTIAENPSRNRIVVTHGKLAAAYNTENIDRVLLVELAHACQFALVSESATDYRTFTNPATRCHQSSGELMFEAGMDPELGACLTKELNRQIAEIPEESRGNYCFGKWFREAFSDMKFRKHFSSPYHWTYDMARRSIHKNYGSVYQYMRCGFPEEWKAKMCLENPSKN